MATRPPSLERTVTRLMKRTVPAFLASRCEASETREAVPPMWKVRMVSWVPGSPMDCAAMTRRLAHLHHLAGAEVTAIAEDADAALGLAGEDRANLDALDARGLNGGGEFFGDLLVDLDDGLALVVLSFSSETRR